MRGSLKGFGLLRALMGAMVAISGVSELAGPAVGMGRQRVPRRYFVHDPARVEAARIKRERKDAKRWRDYFRSQQNYHPWFKRCGQVSYVTIGSGTAVNWCMQPRGERCPDCSSVGLS